MGELKLRFVRMCAIFGTSLFLCSVVALVGSGRVGGGVEEGKLDRGEIEPTSTLITVLPAPHAHLPLPSSPPPPRFRPIAILSAGDVRTLLCESVQRNWRRRILVPLRKAGYGPIHVFLRLTPSLFFGSSNWASRKCGGNNQTIFGMVQTSRVSAGQIRQKLSYLGSSSATVHLDILSHDQTLRNHRFDISGSSYSNLSNELGCFHLNSTLKRLKTLYRLRSQWRGVYSVYQSMLRFEKDNGFEFDFVLRIRPDLKLKTSITLPYQPHSPSPLNFTQIHPNKSGKTALNPPNRIVIDQNPRYVNKICHHGDGSAMMHRNLSFAYFTTYERFEKACEIDGDILRGGGLTIDSLYIHHVRANGVGLDQTNRLGSNEKV
ncbi:hypothetical protein AAMO2058_000056300 [Amorphochlora amoebiformis]